MLAVRTVPAGLTAMQALDREANVKTRYGGRFVQAIEGIDGDASKQRDWFWFLNGIEADRSAADYRLHAGDVEWWDFRRGAGQMREPVVVGAFPGAVPARLRRASAPARCATRRGSAPAPRDRRASCTPRRSRPSRTRLPRTRMSFTQYEARERFTASLRDSGDAGAPVRFVFAGDAHALAKHPDRFRYRYQVP